MITKSIVDSPGLRFAGPPSLRLCRKEGKKQKQKFPSFRRRRREGWQA